MQDSALNALNVLFIIYVVVVMRIVKQCKMWTVIYSHVPDTWSREWHNTIYSFDAKNNDKLHQVPKQKPGKNCNVPATKTSG